MSIRTICNCRKLVNIPNYKEKAPCYYEKEITFSAAKIFSKKCFHKIPKEAGVYELSVSSKNNYRHYKSNVIYIGCSRNLRKRLGNYSGNKLKNGCLKKIISNNNVFLRFYLTENYILLEKKLLKNFKTIMASCQRLIV